MTDEGALQANVGGTGHNNEALCLLSTSEMSLVPIDIELSTENAFKIPIEKILSLGSAFLALKDIFTTTGTVPQAFVPVDAAGNLLNPDVLFNFREGIGQLGHYKNVAGELRSAHWVKAAPGASLVPFDPMTLAIAAMVLQVNMKLDAIQKTQEEMFEYLRQKDKAELRGDLQVLEDLRRAYSSNFDNDLWRKNAHMKVMDIKQEMEKASTHLRGQIKAKLRAALPVETRLQIGARLDEVCDRMREYQLSSHVYAFAAFLEPLLSESYDAVYLGRIADQIREHALQYRELYTETYEAIERSAKSSLDAVLLDGVSAAGGLLGRAIAATPLGDKTKIDETLMGVGEGVGSFNDEQTNELMKKLRETKSPGMTSFREAILSMNELYNKPMRIAADKENIYLIPETEE